MSVGVEWGVKDVGRGMIGGRYGDRRGKEEVGIWVRHVRVPVPSEDSRT